MNIRPTLPSRIKKTRLLHSIYSKNLAIWWSQKNFLAVKLRGAFIYTQPCIQSNRTRPHVSRNSENISAKIPKFRKVSKLSTPSISCYRKLIPHFLHMCIVHYNLHRGKTVQYVYSTVIEIHIHSETKCLHLNDSNLILKNPILMC